MTLGLLNAATKICMGNAVGRGIADAPPQQSEGRTQGYLARGLSRDYERGVRRAGNSAPAPRLGLERMVQPGKYARHRLSFLAHASSFDETREEDDARGRRRHLVRMHGDPPS